VHTRTRQRDSIVESVVVDRAIPVIDTVLRRRCRDWAAGRGMLDDLRGEVVVRLLRRLRETSDEAAAPIENLEGYVAGIASRVIDDAIRVSCPEWTRLKHRVRYLVTHDARFRLLADDDRPIVSLTRTGGVRMRTTAAEKLAIKVVELLRTTGDQLALDDVVSALAESSGISDRVTPWENQFAASDPAALLESADELRMLWREIAALPPRQRAALLLHARDSGGESVLRLLSAASLVSSRDVASALEVPKHDLGTLLRELPLSDSVIARRLGVTVQQVINLRKAARDRLARRLSRAR